MKADTRVKFPISVKLAIFAGSITVLCTVVLGLWLTEISRDTLTTAGRDYRLAVAEDVANAIRMEASAAQTALATAAELLSEPRLEQDAKLAIVLSYVGISDAIDHVHVYDINGSYIDSMREPGIELAPLDDLSEELRERADRGIVVTGTSGDEDGVARTTFVSVIRAGDVTTGYIATAAPMSGISRRIETLGAERLRSASATVRVVDREARVVATSGGEAVGTSQADHPLFDNLEVMFDKRIATSAEVVVGGVSVVASALPLPELGWVVVVEVPTAVAYAAVDAMRRSIWIAVLVFLLIALVASVLGARRITGPLRRLGGFARALAARDFEQRATVESADEVGLLAEVLNGAADDLKASEEAIRRETRIRSDLGRYLPQELVDAIVEERQNLDLGGVRAPITIMFADVVRFTPLCEKLAPEKVVALLNELFTIVTEIIFRHGGTVDKFIGDGVMAFWGAPDPCDDHADRALRAADDILRFLEVGNEGWKERFGVELELAIGVNTGHPIVGNIGSKSRMEYTTIGEAVNVAARLEALARPNQVLTTAATRAEATSFDFAKVSEEVLTSGDQPIEVWEVVL